jgi:hypothetical protein
MRCVALKLCKQRKGAELQGKRIARSEFPHGFQQNCLKLLQTVHT